MKKSDITQFACGVLFGKSFSILDEWGSIADKILYKSKYFSEKYFTNIESSQLQGRLYNKDEDHSLLLNPENLIYTHICQQDESFEHAYSLFSDRLVKFLIPEIIEKRELVVKRIGIVFTASIDENEYEKFVKLFFLPNVKGITSFRFSQKDITPSGAITVGQDDFVNKIYSLAKTDENKTQISYDFQLHFIPPRLTALPKHTKFVLEKGRDAFLSEAYGIK